MARRTPTYAPVIRYLRETYPMTRAELAKRLGVPDYYVGYLEEGYRFPRPPQVESLARIFGWSAFELALVADVDIPYPDWPRLTDVDAWFRLANQWVAVADAIHRYGIARTLYRHPEWIDLLSQEHEELLPLVSNYGFVAVYGFVRRQWQTLVPHKTRMTPPASIDEVLQAIVGGGDSRPIATANDNPAWWDRLDPKDRATIDALAQSLLRRPPPHESGE